MKLTICLSLLSIALTVGQARASDMDELVQELANQIKADKAWILAHPSKIEQNPKARQARVDEAQAAIDEAQAKIDEAAHKRQLEEESLLRKCPKTYDEANVRMRGMFLAPLDAYVLTAGDPIYWASISWDTESTNRDGSTQTVHHYREYDFPKQKILMHDDR